MTPPNASLRPIRWRKLFFKTATVVATEFLMNAAGLDTIATYAEFLNEHHNNVIEIATTIITTCS